MRKIVPVFVMLVACGVFGLVAAPANASVTAVKSYPAPFVAKAPPLDPEATTTAWAQAIVADDFVNVLTKTAAVQSTRAEIIFDTTSVYVRITCEQPNEPITTDPKAQGFGSADFAGIGIDPSGTGANVYYFGVTPTGTQYFLNSRSATYQPRWASRSIVGPKSWTTVIAVPFNVLTLEPTPQQRWRFNVVRHVAATNDDLTWAYDQRMKIPDQQAAFAAATTGLLGQGSPQAQAQQNALNAANQGVNPLGLSIWPTTADAPFWPSVTGSIPVALLPKGELIGAGIFSAGVDRGRFFQLGNGGSYVPQGIPYSSLAAHYHVLPNVEISAAGNEYPLVSNVAQLNGYLQRPFFLAGGAAYYPARAVPLSSTSGPDTVVAPYSLGEMTHAFKVNGTVGTTTFSVMNAVGVGMNDILIGARRDDPGQLVNLWVNSALTHHGAGYLGTDIRQGSTQAGEIGIGGRDPKTGLAYLASYALVGGSFPTQPLPNDRTINPGLASKLALVLGVENLHYTVHAAYTAIGPQFSPADGSVSVAGAKGPSLEATTQGVGPAGSPLRTYLVRAYGIRQTDPSGSTAYTANELSIDLVAKNQIELAIGESLATRQVYGLGTPAFPQLTGYAINYLGRAYQRAGGLSVLLGYKNGSPSFIDAAYTTGPNPLFALSPAFAAGIINGSQQTATVFGQTKAVGFTLQAAYGVNRGFYPGVEQSFVPGKQTQGQTLRYLALSRPIDGRTYMSVGYQSVVGSPTGASSPSTFVGGTLVHYLRDGQGQMSLAYGSTPRSPFFAFSRALAGWNYPSYVIGCVPGAGLCNLNRVLLQYQRVVGI